MSNSANLNLNLQTTGSNDGTWGLVLNSNFNILDSRLGARLSIDVSGASNVTVTALQAQNFIQILTGTLTGNIKYILPATGGIYFINNTTSGAFTITIVNNASGTGIVLPQGSAQLFISNPDNTTVYSSFPSSIGSLTVTGATTLNTLTVNSTATITGAVTLSALNSVGVVTTNGSGVLATNAQLPAGQMPALTGDVTNTAGNLATTIAAKAVSLAKMADGTQGGVIVYGAAGAASSTGAGTSGYVLTAQGAGATPVWAAQSAGISSVVRQVFTSSGTYTPTSGMQYCDVEVQGAGGGGFGGSPGYGGSGGGGGGYAKKIISAATVGASKSITIGTGGTGGTSGSAGSDGGQSVFGSTSLLYATGGIGAVNQGASAPVILGGAGGQGFLGDYNISGQDGAGGNDNYSVIGGAGGDSQLGRGGAQRNGAGASGSLIGQDGKGYGGGGSGGANGTSGGNGAAGIIIITEYVR